MIMEKYGKVNTRRAKEMVKVLIHILMKNNILDNILMMSAMDREH